MSKVCKTSQKGSHRDEKQVCYLLMASIKKTNFLFLRLGNFQKIPKGSGTTSGDILTIVPDHSMLGSSGLGKSAKGTPAASKAQQCFLRVYTSCSLHRIFLGRPHSAGNRTQFEL